MCNYHAIYVNECNHHVANYDVALQALDRENEMPITEHQIGIERTHSQSHKFKNKVETENSSAIKEYHSYKLVLRLYCNRQVTI